MHVLWGIEYIDPSMFAPSDLDGVIPVFIPGMSHGCLPPPCKIKPAWLKFKQIMVPMASKMQLVVEGLGTNQRLLSNEVPREQEERLVPITVTMLYIIYPLLMVPFKSPMYDTKYHCN